MPGEVIDPELPGVWVAQALRAPDPRWQIGQGGGWSAADWAQASAAAGRLQASLGGRLWPDYAAETKPTFPYLVWNITDDAGGRVEFYLPRLLPGQKRAIVRVMRLDWFAGGRGTHRNASPTYEDLCRCLLGAVLCPVYTGAPPSERLLGYVTESRLVPSQSDHRRSYRDEQTQALIVETGLTFYVVYKGP